MKKTAAIILLILITGAVIWYGASMVLNRSQSFLSEDKVSQMILKKYGGTIKNISTNQENYTLTLVKDEMSYDITVNGRTGEVLSFTKQTSLETRNNRQQETKEPQEDKQSRTTSVETPITNEKAKEIALEKVSGTVTSVELDEEDGQLVYEVEIDQTKTKKADVVINAYSGKIESITFETDEED